MGRRAVAIPFRHCYLTLRVLRLRNFPDFQRNKGADKYLCPAPNSRNPPAASSRLTSNFGFACPCSPVSRSLATVSHRRHSRHRLPISIPNALIANLNSRKLEINIRLPHTYQNRSLQRLPALALSPIMLAMSLIGPYTSYVMAPQPCEIPYLNLNCLLVGLIFLVPKMAPVPSPACFAL